MFEVYFTPNQVDNSLAFAGKNGATLKVVLGQKFKNNPEECVAHIVASMLQMHFNVAREFVNEKEHKDSYKVFAKTWRKCMTNQVCFY